MDIVKSQNHRLSLSLQFVDFDDHMGEGERNVEFRSMDF